MVLFVKNKPKIKNNTNIVKVVKDRNNNVLYLSRGNVPFEFKKTVDWYYKHLSIVSFKPKALEKFTLSKKSRLEKRFFMML